MLKIAHNVLAATIVVCGIVRCFYGGQVDNVYYGSTQILFGLYGLLVSGHLFKKGGR